MWWKREAVVVGALLLAPAFLPAVAAVTDASAKARIERLDSPTQAAMVGVSWSPACPVALNDLRRVVVPFVDFDGTRKSGVLVVHRDVSVDVGRIFEALFTARFPVARIDPIEAFGGDDDASTMANNTSAFNCRPSFGADGKPTKRWSQHAYGRAIDVNPVQNPYVLADGSVLDPEARPYLDRTATAPGMAVRRGVLVEAFAARGWKWGGAWRATKDYQHFSVTGG